MTAPENPAYGSNDHARLITFGRHPDVQSAMAWLTFTHLPERLQSISRPLYVVAGELLRRIPIDSPELTDSLNRLVRAKDGFVRAGIRSDQGFSGSTPRLATVVDPPTDWPQTARDLISGDADRIAQHMPQWRENWPTTPTQAVKPIHHYDDPEA